MLGNFSIVHRAGNKHQGAVALSQHPAKTTYESEINDDMPILLVSMGVLKGLMKVQDKAPEKTQIEAKDPLLATLVEFISA